LTRIESNAFSSSSLQSIIIPSTVQILGSSCFSDCKSLSSISFAHPSQVKPLEYWPFDQQTFVVKIPSTIRFVGFDAIPNHFQISIAHCDSCVEFDRWLELRESGISVDFRRILRIDSELHGLNNYLIDLSTFEERSVLDEIDGNLSEMYERSEDGSLVIVNSKNRFESKENLIIEIENQLNLSHSCILSPIGFIFGPESRELTVSGELKIVELYSEGSSLSQAISENPIWWTATAKAKAIAGIVLGLQFAHSLGLIHGHLNSKNIRFDLDHRIQITNFCQIDLEVSESEKDMDILSSERWSPHLDVRAFALVLFEIIVGHPMMQSGVGNGQIRFPANVPLFVLELIEAAQSPGSRGQQTFNDIFNILKENDFEIVSGVDSADVLTFVDWVESFE
jgi:serine/threonine protein kinase